jgi:hypothetical protein
LRCDARKALLERVVKPGDFVPGALVPLEIKIGNRFDAIRKACATGCEDYGG